MIPQYDNYNTIHTQILNSVYDRVYIRAERKMTMLLDAVRSSAVLDLHRFVFKIVHTAVIESFL